MVNGTTIPDSGGRRGKRVLGTGPAHHAQRRAGALALLRAAADAGVHGGDYYTPAGRLEFRGAPVRRQSSRPSHNPELAHRLWDVSGQLTGVIYPL